MKIGYCNTVIKLTPISKQHQSLYQQLYQSDAVMNYVCSPLSDAACLRSFDSLLGQLDNPNKRVCFAIEIEESGIDVGLLDAKYAKEAAETEVGILLLPEFHGRGMAKQAHQLLFSRMQQHQTNRFIARCHVDNQAAHHLYQKLGFKQLSNNQNKQYITWEKKSGKG